VRPPWFIIGRTARAPCRRRPVNSTLDVAYIEQSWSIIERVLLTTFPSTAATLNSGASLEKIAELEALVGRPLPADFRASLCRHDGQSDPTRQLDLLNFNRLLTIDEMLHEWKMMTELFADFGAIDWLQPVKIKNLVWSPGWIKFSDADGDGFVLDLDPTDLGSYGQVFYRPNAENQTQTWADSYSGFLARLAEILDQGGYELENGCPYVQIPIG
jgi:cell wall assembly regulator SMI1